MGAATLEAIPGTSTKRRYLIWRVAVPPEKGGWVWWLGPLGVGALAAPELRPELFLVVLGGFCAFCLRQPLTLALKRLRRGQNELAPPLAWAATYGALLLLVGTALLALGHAKIVALGAVAGPVFTWYLVLVYLGRERHQHLLDLAAAAALALTGPAAYLVCGGQDGRIALWIFLLSSLQSCASVVHMFLRLEQRGLRSMPPLKLRAQQGALPLAAHLGAFGAASYATSLGITNPLAVVALLLPLLEGLESVLRPPVRHTPKRVGMRQLALSIVALLLLGFSFAPVLGLF